MSYDKFNTLGMRNTARSIDEAMSQFESAKKNLENILNNMKDYFSDPTSAEYTRKMKSLLAEMEKEEKAVRGFSNKLKHAAGIVERRVNGIKL